MSYWNYRVIKRQVRVSRTEVENLFDIQEVYYSDDGTINGYCNADVTDWESIEDLKGTLESMLKAFDKPVLNGDEVEELR